MTNKRILWIDSTELRSDPYIDSLADAGYDIDRVRTFYNGLARVYRSAYDAVCLDPFLSLGTPNQGQEEIDPIEVGLSESVYNYGFYLFKKIREGGANVSKPVLLMTEVPLNHPFFLELKRKETKQPLTVAVSLIDESPDSLVRRINGIVGR